jgi:hypothetical protein
MARKKTASSGKQPSKGGRTNTYDPKRYPSIAAALMRKGATRAELAVAFNVTGHTIYDWSRKYPEFFQSIKESAKSANAVIEKSLYDLAQEHTVEETRKIFARDEKTGKGVLVKTEVFTRVVPANITAIAMWLNNRDPGNWRRNPDTNDADDLNKDPLLQMVEEVSDEPDEDGKTNAAETSDA